MCRTRSSVRQRGLRGLLHAQPAVRPMLPPWLVSAVLLHVTWSHRARATCRAAARRRDRRCGPGGLLPAPPKRFAPARHPAHAAPFVRRSLEEPPPLIAPALVQVRRTAHPHVGAVALGPSTHVAHWLTHASDGSWAGAGRAHIGVSGCPRRSSLSEVVWFFFVLLSG